MDAAYACKTCPFYATGEAASTVMGISTIKGYELTKSDFHQVGRLAVLLWLGISQVTCVPSYHQQDQRPLQHCTTSGCNHQWMKKAHRQSLGPSAEMRVDISAMPTAYADIETLLWQQLWWSLCSDHISLHHLSFTAVCVICSCFHLAGTRPPSFARLKTLRQSLP